jgi:serine/threonine protein kinase
VTEYTSEQPAGRHLGRYIVRRRIGAGGFARVYLGWDPDLEIEVAIKIPKPQLAEDEGALERFRREATTAARLRHPNVVTVLTVGRIDERFDGVPTDTPYLVMDYLPESLASRLTATPTLPEAEWLQIGAEVGRGLAYAHSRSVIHRDIKPDNILFGRHGEAVLTDFGIARAVVEGMTAASRSIVVGTPEYFSPEQARGLPFDQRTDIYGLGVTLFRAATGALPFTGVDWYAIMRQHVEDAPPAPRSLNPALSVEAERLILRCLAKAPDDRYQRVDDLLIDIETARQRLGRGGGYGPVGETVELGRAYVARRRSSRVWNAVAVARGGRRGPGALVSGQKRVPRDSRPPCRCSPCGARRASRRRERATPRLRSGDRSA